MANEVSIYLHYFDIKAFEMSALNCTSLTAALDQVADGISTEEGTGANRLSAEIHPVINILFNLSHDAISINRV